MNRSPNIAHKKSKTLFVANTQIQNFIFPSNFKRSRSLKSINSYIKRIQTRSKEKISRNSVNFNMDSSTVVLPNHIVHTFAIPNRTLTKIKTESKPNLRNYESQVKLLMKRFNSTFHNDHIIKLERKGMKGCKTNSSLPLNFLKMHDKKLRGYISKSFLL